MEGMVNVSETKRKDCSNNPQFRRKELENIIRERKIRIVYQPIVNVKTGEIMGYEALTRGPEGSPLFSPVDLFSGRYGQPIAFCVGTNLPRRSIKQHTRLKIVPTAISQHECRSC